MPSGVCPIWITYLSNLILREIIEGCFTPLTNCVLIISPCIRDGCFTIFGSCDIMKILMGQMWGDIITSTRTMMIHNTVEETALVLQNFFLTSLVNFITGSWWKGEILNPEWKINRTTEMIYISTLLTGFSTSLFTSITSFNAVLPKYYFLTGVLGHDGSRLSRVEPHGFSLRSGSLVPHKLSFLKWLNLRKTVQFHRYQELWS